MYKGKNLQKPSLSSQQNQKKVQSLQQKLKKIQLFFRYRLPSIYRQLKKPIYEEVTKMKATMAKNNSMQNKKNGQISEMERNIQILYKKVMLNSKYHHRQKMRFSRMPMLKYLKYDFQALNEKLKSKAYCKIYDDLEESDDEDQGKEKKQYAVDPMFNQDFIARYKKKHGIEGKIIISHGYDGLKERLISEYGWVQNEDVESLIYDYKHMSKKKDIDYVNMLENQAINHFNENKSVTAKFGLTRNIRNLASLNKNMHQFFPRCYDVNDVSELQNFYESFKQTYAQSILNNYLTEKGKIPLSMAQISEKISKRRLLPIDEKIKLIQKQKNMLITIQEFNFLKDYEKQLNVKKAEEKVVNEKLFEEIEGFDQIARKQDPQWRINKDNIWIVKPASLSRGRGIKTFDDIQEIFDYVIGKEISWVIQKYIQNPLVIKKRKFDIRQWVVLTDFKPFRVWVYQECYIRFCATEYTPENLKDRKIHLTNNSVTKGISQITNDGINENMMSEKDFRKLLQEMEGKDVFMEKIRPQMNRISLQTLESVKQNIISRKNTMQVFGFDFMVDEDYRVWLIEVNSSPTMEHSTKVTADIVSRGMSDYADLVNNYLFKGKQYKANQAEQLYGGWKLL